MSYLSDEMYNLIYSNSPRLCVDMIIKNESNQILLTKRDQEPYNGFWHTPGGRVRFRESIEDAIVRVCKNETGASPQQVKFVGYCEFLTEVQNGNKRHSVSLFFTMKVYGDLKDGTWYSELPDNIIPEQKQFLLNHKII